ncbi:MAG: addiction module toxin, HicA family [Chloroflexi bacterium]|nr:addiction module toxin, HicA family [Chloroflexota bacterium]MYF23293.1 addiction module toxin, HicA family [Chloroflexota bacterium]
MAKVRDAIRVVEKDGWYLVRTRGSHRHFKHPRKRGTVTIPGQSSKQLPDGTWHNIKKQAGLT